jgi:transposase
MAASTPPPTPPRIEREEVFAWMVANGASVKQAATHFSINHETVKSWTKRYGHPSKGQAQPAGAAPLPNAAAALPADDRAELLAHVRSLRRRLVLFDEKVQAELALERPDVRMIDALTRSASATASEMAKVLEAHPGLMAIVDAGQNTGDADKEAAAIEATYLTTGDR